MKELLDGFSVERLEEIIGRAEFWGHGAGYTPCEVIALARIALAVKQAEPVIDDHTHDYLQDQINHHNERATTALQNFRAAMEGIGHIRRTLEETFGGLHGTHSEPDVLVECKAICDAICDAYQKSDPVLPQRSREHFIALCNEFWNWSVMDLACADDRGYELRMEWDGKVFTHPVTQALWRMYQAAPGNSPAIPDGWALVPKEATKEMLNAAWISHGVHHPSAYRTMLAAAPSPEDRQ